MAARIVRFDPGIVRTVPTQATYWKVNWGDPWTLQTGLWCFEATWSAAPHMPTAQLRYRYGDVKRFLAAQFSRVFPLRDFLRFYVKVEFGTLPTNSQDTSTQGRTWYGVLEIEQDELSGADITSIDDELITFPHGKNHFTAYGLESLLDQHWIDTSLIAASSQRPRYEVPRGLTFNDGVELRRVAKRTIAAGEGNRSVSPEAGGTYLFHRNRTGGKLWHTKAIVEYLLAHQTPKDHAGEAVLQFELYDPNSALPTWDTPIVPADGRTTRECLNSLIARQRGLSWRLEVVEPEEGQGTARILLVPFTFLDEELLFGQDQHILPANPDQVILSLERDRGGAAVLKRSTADAVDQVVAQGARATSTASFSFIDGTLAIGWPTALEEAYEAGASGAADYPAAGEVEERLWYNYEARKADKFKSVYARFVLPDDWDFQVGDGTSGDPGHPIVPDEAALEIGIEGGLSLAPDDQRFLSFLALLEAVDYSGTKIEDDTVAAEGSVPHRYLPPLVLFPRHDSTAQDLRYRHAESIGILSELEVAGLEEGNVWSARAHVDHHDGSLWIDVVNLLNDAIAGDDFTRLADLDPEPLADYREMVATLTIPWSMYAEARYPEEVPAHVQTVRRMYVRAGDVQSGEAYRLDWVVPGTVVALGDDGKLVRSESGGYIRDDRAALADLARVAFEWYGKTRRALAFRTSLVNNALQIGTLVVSVGDPLLQGDVHIDDVLSCITAIRISSPLVTSDARVASEPGVVTITYETAFGELDPLKLR